MPEENSNNVVNNQLAPGVNLSGQTGITVTGITVDDNVSEQVSSGGSLPPEKLYSRGWNEGKKSGINNALGKIKDIFGTSDLDELSSLSNQIRSEQAGRKLQPEVEKRLSELEQANKKLSELNNQIKQEQQIYAAIDQSGLQPRNRKIILREFSDRFELKQTDSGELRVYRSGSDIPLTDGKGSPATLIDAITLLASESDTAFLFDPSLSKISHLNTPTNAGKSNLPDGYLLNINNVQALKGTGQYLAALRGEKIDLRAAQDYLQTTASSKGQAVKIFGL